MPLYVKNVIYDSGGAIVWWRGMAWVAAAVTAVAVLGGSAAGGAPVDRVDGVRSDESERIDTWLEDRMAAHGIPGAAVAVVRHGEIVHLAGYGTADGTGRAVTPDTPFLIGSASKPFTAMAVMQLVEDGVFSLDDRVLPYLAGVTADVPAGFEDVTIRQLLTHTGGLSMSVGLAGTVPIHDRADALDRRVVDLLDQPLSGAAGQRFEYSNAGAMLLAAVTEQVTGRRFADQLRDRVFDPLGMSTSFASDRDPRAAELATGHRLWFGRWRPAALPYDSAGAAMGYIGSTAHDLASFLQAHLDGARADVIPATATEIAGGPVVPTGWDTPLESDYGTGWFVDELVGQRVVSHSGSLGHFTAHLVLVPDADNLGIAVLTNASAFVAAGHGGQYDISLGLTRLLLDEDPGPANRNTLMTLVAPTLTWAIAVLIAFAAVRYLAVALPLWRRGPRRNGGGVRRWMRHVVVPGGAYIAMGATILATVPLAAARHFYPDVGWGLTVTASLALVWGVARTLLAVIARATGKQADAPTDQPAAASGRLQELARHPG